MKTVAIKITPELHKALKMYMAETENSIQNFLESYIVEKTKK